MGVGRDDIVKVTGNSIQKSLSLAGKDPVKERQVPV